MRSILFYIFYIYMEFRVIFMLSQIHRVKFRYSHDRKSHFIVRMEKSTTKVKVCSIIYIRINRDKYIIFPQNEIALFSELITISYWRRQLSVHVHQLLTSIFLVLSIFERKSCSIDLRLGYAIPRYLIYIGLEYNT